MAESRGYQQPPTDTVKNLRPGQPKTWTAQTIPALAVSILRRGHCLAGLPHRAAA